MRQDHSDGDTGDASHSHTERVTRYRAVSRHLAELSESEIVAIIGSGTANGSGIGGTTGSIMVDGVPVFAKSVPLTDLERRPEHIGSTANLFGLPLYYQYGMGSAGFGVWREIAVHELTTGWVLDNLFDGVPLLYHWRVLPRRPLRAMEPAEVRRWVAHWDNSPAVQARLEAISEASATVVLFMEHIPYTLDSWLTTQAAAGGRAAGSAYTWVDSSLRDGVDFLGSQGLLHFDAHFHNLLTDGHRLYFADFGLATYSGFDLGAAEAAFFRRHISYDRCYTITHLTRWLVSRLLGIPWTDSHDYIRDAPGRGYAEMPASAAEIVTRYRPVAVVMGDFYQRLYGTRHALYPARELSRAMERVAGR